MKTGYTYESLCKSSDSGIRHVKADTSSLVFFSYINDRVETGQDDSRVQTFYFYKITKESMKKVESGEGFHTRSKLTFRAETMNEMLQVGRVRQMAKNGIIIRGIREKSLYGFTDNGIRMLCARAGMTKELSEKRTQIRDMLAIEDLLKEETCVLAVKEYMEGLYMIEAVFGAGYQFDDCAMKDFYNKAVEDKKCVHGVPSVTMWKVGDISEFRMEYLNAEFCKKDGHTYIPGLRILDSDVGKSSFRVQAIVREKGKEKPVVIAEKKMRHNNRTNKTEAFVVWKKNLDAALAAHIKDTKKAEGMDTSPFYKDRKELPYGITTAVFGGKKCVRAL